MEDEEDEVICVLSSWQKIQSHTCMVQSVQVPAVLFLLCFYIDLCLFSLQNGLNALHLAAKEGHKDLVEELLDRGAPVDSSTKVDT